MRESVVLCFQLICIVLVLGVMPSVQAYLSPTYLGWMTKACMLSLPFLFFQELKIFLNSSSKLYVFILILGFVVHNAGFVSLEGEDAAPFWQSLRWISLVFLLTLSCSGDHYRIVFYFVASFFFFDCFIALYEKISGNYFFDWSHTDFLSQADSYDDVKEFRSVSLLGHPLNNANVISMLMAFVLCSFLKDKYKLLLLLIGSIALWSFNCRGAMVLWLAIFIYRLFLFDKNGFSLFLSFSILYVVIPYVIQFVATTGVLGRLTFDFSDDSSETRLLSFLYFYNQDWSLERILFGGYIIYMPGTSLTLENGILLTLGWWGWIIGSLKVILEIVISYIALPEYVDKRCKFIIMAATWGVAFMNNNSFGYIPLSFYVVALISFNYLNRNLDLKYYNKKESYDNDF